MTKNEFKAAAKTLYAAIDGHTINLAPKVMSTGSCGFSHSGKLELQVDGKIVRFQVGVNVTAIGSKDWSE